MQSIELKRESNISTLSNEVKRCCRIYGIESNTIYFEFKNRLIISHEYNHLTEPNHKKNAEYQLNKWTLDGKDLSNDEKT